MVNNVNNLDPLEQYNLIESVLGQVSEESDEALKKAKKAAEGALVRPADANSGSLEDIQQILIDNQDATKANGEIPLQLQDTGKALRSMGRMGGNRV